MNWRFWQNWNKLPSPGPTTREIDATQVVPPPSPYHIEFVSERPGKDRYDNDITWVKLRCAKTRKTWEEMDYGRNRYNTCMERSCDGCGERIHGEDFQQDQWGHSREQVKKVIGIDESRDGLTRVDREKLQHGHCPDCFGDQWYEGPSGGMATNYTCANPECGSRFNLALPMFASRISEPQPNKPKVGA